MPDPIELDSVDALGAGAVGEPGQRAFYIQARSESAQLTVLRREGAGRAARGRGDRVPRPHRRRSTPRTPIALPARGRRAARADGAAVPRPLIGLGFDPERELVLIELRERSDDDDDDDDRRRRADTAAPRCEPTTTRATSPRIYATRSQVRAMAAHGAGVVPAGRPRLRLCARSRMDPAGHRCPRWN